MGDNRRILLVYTGGTIGMVQEDDGSYKPFDFSHLRDQIPELNRLQVDIDTTSLDDPIDSSDMYPDIWKRIAEEIGSKYDDYEGFVILHGSDTMAYTASALSFMLENLNKPVVLTGSQLPIGIVRTDAKENLITAIEVASHETNGAPTVKEVCIYFEYHLYRGNRTIKFNAENFEAFRSENYPFLAEAGVHLKFNESALLKQGSGELTVYSNMDSNVAILKVFPGMSKAYVNSILNIPKIKGIVLETFGSGNATTAEWFINEIKEAVSKGIVIVNVSQCHGGSVEQGRYETSRYLKEAGVISGKDITTEAALTKLMYLFGKDLVKEEAKELMIKPLAGEMK